MLEHVWVFNLNTKSSALSTQIYHPLHMLLENQTRNGSEYRIKERSKQLHGLND